ncbi:MAG: MATE family efflux transporter [Clostridia bacterium]|nr:MATE family efflux transporter [Clostridia bacterium]
MMIFVSIYGVVDGYFVSNFVGKEAFTAVNLIMPVLMILGSFGFMMGAGGSALIAKTRGEGDDAEANRLFSFFVYILSAFGVVVAVVSFIFARNISVMLGAEGQILEDCVTYGRIIIAVLPFQMLQFAFQSYFITAEKPQLGLYSTIIAGVANMVLDALLIMVFNMGIVGAALATAGSQFLGGIVPIIYFARENQSPLKLSKAKFKGKPLLKAVTNGSSEFVSNVALSIVSIFYNLQLMKYAGEDGVAAYGVIMYVAMIFLAVFIGYSTGIAPAVGYHFGAKNKAEIKSLLRKSITVICIMSLTMFVLAEVFAYNLADLFVGYDADLMKITLRGFYIGSFSYLFVGFSIFGSALFTALNDGVTSAVISFLRSLVFQIATIMIFPLIWGVDGIWLSLVTAEIMADIITVIFLIRKKKYFN